MASYDYRLGAEGFAAAIIERLGSSLQHFRSGNGKGTSKGFAYLRERAEAAGIFVLFIGNLGSHLLMISHPDEVAEIIENAAK